MDTEELVGWAKDHAENLTREMVWTRSEYGGYWEADDRQAKGRIRARATAALDFLERFSGVDSRWSEDARYVFANNGENQSMESGARAVGVLIREWAHMVACGQVKPRLVESFSVRAASSSDLLDQVRVLNGNKEVAPAAPMVLAGAALEVALRAAIDELGLTIEGSGINAYAQALHRARVLNKQDLKEVTYLAGLRNQAAHGEHGLLTRRGAILMEQQVNSFLSRFEQAVEQSI